MNFENNEKSLPEKLSEDIINYILEKNLQAGDKLPNETVFSNELGASRGTLREAIKLLASRNIVTVRQGSGTYIAGNPGVVDDPLGFTFIGDKKKLTLDLLEIRFLIEPYIAQMAAINADDDEIKNIIKLCDEVEALMLEGKDHTQKDIEFHKAIAKSCKNLVMPRIIPIINASIPLFVQLTNNILKEETISTHREIANAIRDHKPMDAKDAMYLHLVYNRRVLNQNTK